VIWWNPSAGSPSDSQGGAAGPLGQRRGTDEGRPGARIDRVERRPGDRHTVAEVSRELSLGQRAQGGEERLQEGAGASPGLGRPPPEQGEELGGGLGQALDGDGASVPHGDADPVPGGVGAHPLDHGVGDLHRRAAHRDGHQPVVVEADVGVDVAHRPVETLALAEPDGDQALPGTAGAQVADLGQELGADGPELRKLDGGAVAEADAHREGGRLTDLGDLLGGDPQRLAELRGDGNRAAVHLRGAVSLVHDLAARGGQAVMHGGSALGPGGSERGRPRAADPGHADGVPHSPQNLIPSPSSVPQFLQKRLVAAGAAASTAPQCWQNLPPPDS